MKSLSEPSMKSSKRITGELAVEAENAVSVAIVDHVHLIANEITPKAI